MDDLVRLDHYHCIVRVGGHDFLAALVAAGALCCSVTALVIDGLACYCWRYRDQCDQRRP